MNLRLATTSTVLLLVALRAGCEYGLMSEHGPDAQMGIWGLFAMSRLAIWLVTGLLAAGLLVFAWPNRGRSTAALGLMLTWALLICWSSSAKS